MRTLIANIIEGTTSALIYANMHVNIFQQYNRSMFSPDKAKDRVLKKYIFLRLYL